MSATVVSRDSLLAVLGLVHNAVMRFYRLLVDNFHYISSGTTISPDIVTTSMFDASEAGLNFALMRVIDFMKSYGSYPNTRMIEDRAKKDISKVKSAILLMAKGISYAKKILDRILSEVCKLSESSSATVPKSSADEVLMYILNNLIPLVEISKRLQKE